MTCGDASKSLGYHKPRRRTGSEKKVCAHVLSFVALPSPLALSLEIAGTAKLSDSTQCLTAGLDARRQVAFFFQSIYRFCPPAWQ
jgi:hypothetical protein